MADAAIESYGDNADVNLSSSVKENGVYAAAKANSPQPRGGEAATDHNDNSVGLNGHGGGENGYASDNGHHQSSKYDPDLDHLELNETYSGIKASSLGNPRDTAGVEESYTTLSSNGFADRDLVHHTLTDYQLQSSSDLHDDTSRSKRKNGRGEDGEGNDGITFDYDLKAATRTTTASNSSRRDFDSDAIPALYDRAYIDDIIKRALNPIASSSPPPTRGHVTKQPQHQQLLKEAGKPSDDDLEPHHRQGYLDGSSGGGAKVKVKVGGKYDAYDFSSPTSSPRSSRRKLQQANAGVGDLDSYESRHSSRLEKSSYRGTNSYYTGGAAGSKFDYEPADYGGAYGGAYGSRTSHVGSRRRDRGDVNVKYFGPDSDTIYTGEDFEAAAQAEQDQEPALPDEDFLPQKRPETDEIVKEKTVGARLMVNQQSNVIEKLKNTSKSLDELDEDLRELQQMFLDVQLRHARVCDRDPDGDEEEGLAAALQQYALPRRHARPTAGDEAGAYGYDDALGASTASPSLRRRRLQGPGHDGGSDFDGEGLLTGGSLSHLAGYRFKPRDSEYFDFGYTPSAGAGHHRYDSLLAPSTHYDRFGGSGYANAVLRESSENLYGVRGSSENLYGIDEGNGGAGGGAFARLRAVSPRRHGDAEEEMGGGGGGGGGYYDSGNPSYYCTLRNPKKLGLAGYVSSIGASSYRPKSAAVLTVNTPVLDALSSGKTYHHLSTPIGGKSYGLSTSSIGLGAGAGASNSLKAAKDDDGEFRSKFLRKVRQKKAAGETVLPSGEKKSRFLKK